ncbi:MAG: hypothetical protein JSV07_03685, partial [Acidimicrobiia bacterium]
GDAGSPVRNEEVGEAAAIEPTRLHGQDYSGIAANVPDLLVLTKVAATISSFSRPTSTADIWGLPSG